MSHLYHRERQPQDAALVPENEYQQLQLQFQRPQQQQSQQQQQQQRQPDELWDTGSQRMRIGSSNSQRQRQQDASSSSSESGSPFAAAAPDHSIILLRRGRSVQVCGDNLVETLSLICGGKYNRPDKRTISFVLLGKRPLLSDNNNSMKSSSSSSNGDDEQAGEMFLRNVRGVADECCLNSCSMSQLRSYCAS
jgi:hypothetical protein